MSKLNPIYLVKALRKNYCFLLIFSLFPIIGFGQKQYYSTDSRTQVGIVLVEGGAVGNARFCQVKKGDTIIKYSPDEVLEYRFRDGRFYKSFPVRVQDTISRYFLECLVEGNINLYYLRANGGIKKYYLTEGSSTHLFELKVKKKECRILFDSLVRNCPHASKNIKYIKSGRNGFIRFLEDYNKCTQRPYPRFRYGFAVGADAMKFSIVEVGTHYSVPDYTYDWNISFGAFIDIPLISTNFSFHPEIYYGSIGVSEPFLNNKINYDLLINYSSLSFPVLFRYCIPTRIVSPYFQGGPVYSRAIKNESALYQYSSNGNEITINTLDLPVLHNDLLGLSIGSGIIFNQGSKYSFFSEFTYSKLYNLGQEKKLLNIGGFSIRFGLIF